MPPKKHVQSPKKRRKTSEVACNVRGRPYLPRRSKEHSAALSSSDPLEKPSKEAVSLMASEGLTLAHVSTQVATLEASDQQLTTTLSDAATDTPPQAGVSYEHYLAWGAHLARTFKHPTLEALFQRALDHLPTMRVTSEGEYSAPSGKSKEFKALLDILGFDRSQCSDIGLSAKAARANTVLIDISIVIHRTIHKMSYEHLVDLVNTALSESPSDPESYVATAITKGSCASVVRFIRGTIVPSPIVTQPRLTQPFSLYQFTCVAFWICGHLMGSQLR